MASDGRKMSKRYGNVINPDDIVETFGADSLRIYEMFMGPFDQSIAWSTDNMMGARRFIERLWKLQEKLSPDNLTLSRETELLLHQTIKKVGGDIEKFAFNTAVSQMMILVNHLEKLDVISLNLFRIVTKILAPVAPHVAEEFWTLCGDSKGSVHTTLWPSYDEAKIISDTSNIAIQSNRKIHKDGNCYFLFFIIANNYLIVVVT